MRITILALGSLGDVKPAVAFALGLQRAGHSVRLGAPPLTRELVTAHGIEYVPLGQRPIRSSRSGRAGPGVNRWTMRGAMKGAWLYFRSLFSKDSASVWPVRVPFAEHIMDDCWAACDKAELILLCRHIPWFYQVVEQTGIPYVLWDLYPFSVTNEFPNLFLLNLFRRWPRASIAIIDWLSPRTSFNNWTHRSMHRISFDISVRLANTWTQERLKLPPTMNTTPFATRWGEPATLYGFSAAVAAPADWPASHYVTGYWFLDENAEWRPSADLMQFLSDGPAPICFHFGMPDANDLATIVATLSRTGDRAVILAPRKNIGSSKVPANIFIDDSISHDWLFRRVSVVVFQGDTTTTGEVLRAGVPSIVALSGRGMLFWAHRLYKLGVSPLPIARGGLTSKKLVNVVRQTLDNPQFRERAIAISQKMQNEDGVAEAVQIFEQQLLVKASVKAEDRRSPACS